jgi:hypothetical protein
MCVYACMYAYMMLPYLLFRGIVALLLKHSNN